jgi:hypothetical protein
VLVLHGQGRRRPLADRYRLEIAPADRGCKRVVAGREAPDLTIEQLGVLHDPDVRAVRRFEVVLLDEGAPRPWREGVVPESLIAAQARLDLSTFTWDQAIPVTLPPWCGVTESVELRHGGERGLELRAIARLDDTVLGSIVWRALRDGTLAAVCPLLLDVERIGDRWLNGELSEVQLIAPGGGCLPTTKILRVWEEPA